MDVVYAMDSGHVGGPDGLMVMIQKGTHWPATDPVVTSSPGMFSPDPRWGLCWTVPVPAESAVDGPPAEPLVPARRSGRQAS